ncbi:hypothetical protein KKA93_02460 [Patescibacteria group bacterium]|nr:hypothetical protein [Patescibacteria group bacterium]MBU1663693.1 hypothetical protein [Patescibacteria group bacterium]MBU2233345.1 hypothetical protein [Patescibacteria group bacterium]MBU2264164.1 hypothetical protein [Patescibacteria group bacterium]
MKAGKLILISTILIITWFFAVCYSAKIAETSSLTASGASPDAIAIRVVPNPDHYSPLRWYKKNIKIQGSPQSLVIDGYEAVRDGRTVYVNAANISNNNFFTNIYIISYNQEAENKTIDVFSQLLSHWEFNTNILLSQDKDNVRADTKRLADLAEIKIALDNYGKTHNGDFPALTVGSYVVGKSISVWPSWSATLGKELGITLPIDPVNKLGTCLGYDDTTCWNQTTQKFAGVPPNSRVYIYTYDGTKKSYNVCGLMESSYLTTLEQGACISL